MDKIDQRILLSAKELSELFQITPTYLSHQRCKGEGPPFHKTSRKKVWYDFEDIKTYLETHRKVNVNWSIWTRLTRK